MFQYVHNAARRLISVHISRLIFGLFMALAVVALYLTDVLMTDRLTANDRISTDNRIALFSSNLISELQRNSIVPQLLSRDPELLRALATEDFMLSSSRLLSFVDEIGAASLTLTDRDGRIVAATDRSRLGELHRSDEFFVQAVRSNRTVFSTVLNDEDRHTFIYSRRMESAARNGIAGVIAVEVDLDKLKRSWARPFEATFVADSAGRIILSTEPLWSGLTEPEAMLRMSAQAAIERATPVWSVTGSDFWRSRDVTRREIRVPFQGWRMVNFNTDDSVRARVNAALALEIMAFAVLFAIGAWVSSRRAESRMRRFQQERDDLRQLNARLRQEMAERRKVEKTLEVAEQSLAQSSKLAALGEMAAAVSHELNQPLAAMRTYLAGAQLLIERRCPQEASVSLQRMDDLIGRMGEITKQLKSYARKGGSEFGPVDVKVAISEALSIIEMRQKDYKVDLRCNFPTEAVQINGDTLRLQQVIINLLSNAFDATKGIDTPVVTIELLISDMLRIRIADNGHGIENLDALFEPFYTTKQPGDGVGLGLAISSGIIKDFGGRLTAHNIPEGGAVFEIELPVLSDDETKANAL